MHCGVHCRLFHWFLGKCFLVEVHPYMTCFCTFWQSAFSVTCFGVFFGGGNKCVGLHLCGGWCWNGNVVPFCMPHHVASCAFAFIHVFLLQVCYSCEKFHNLFCHIYKEVFGGK